MNESSHPDEHDATARISASLNAAADGLELEPIDTAVGERRAVRRRRRRTVLGGVTAVAAIGAVGAVVATDRGDDSIELSAPETTEPATTAPGSDDEAPASTAPTTTPITTPPTMPPVAVSEAGTAVFDAGDSAALSVGRSSQLLPWRDGFLRLTTEFQPQPLPELPDEITALFPDEVIALFPDGLPPTIAEATEILGEAGLLDEVSAVLADHPEVSEAIYSTPPPDPILRASFTSDGEQWQTIELDSPLPQPGQFNVSGDRLVTWTTEFDEGSTNPRRGPTSSDLVLAWTDDLTAWTTVTVPIAATPDPRPYAVSEAYVNGVAFAGDRWAAVVQENTWFDLEALLPVDLIAEFDDHGYDLRTDDDGMHLTGYDQDGKRAETQTFTWSELGLDGNPQAEFDDDAPGATTVLTAVLDGPVSEAAAPAELRWASLFAAGDRFLLGGNRAFESADATNWTEVSLPFEHLNGVTELRNGTLLFGDGPSGQAAALRDPSGSIREVALPELEHQYWIGGHASGAWVVELWDEEEYMEEDWEPITVTVENDTHRVVITEGPEGTSFDLLDLASGDVVLDDVRPYDGGESFDPWEWDDDAEIGWFVARDADGNEITRFSSELFDAAYEAAYETTVADTIPADEAPPPPPMPELWLIATADAENWLTLPLPVPDPETGFWPHSAAVNGDRVVYETADGFVITTLPTG